LAWRLAMSWLSTLIKDIVAWFAYRAGQKAGEAEVHQQEVQTDDAQARAILRSQQDAPDTRADLSRELRDGSKF
jgi:hypothetical protein